MTVPPPEPRWHGASGVSPFQELPHGLHEGHQEGRQKGRQGLLMPRKPRNPGSGKAPHNGPASGIPAQGAGWGGAAKGASTSRLREKGDPESDAIRALSTDPAHMAIKEAVEAEMLGVQIEIARTSSFEGNRLTAADKVLDRLRGKPKQQTDITSNGERIGYVIEAPAEAPDAEAWAAQHRPH